MACKTVDNRGFNLPAIPAGETDENGVPLGNDFTSDINVRRAINLAIDRDEMIEHVLNGYGTAAYSVCDQMPWYNAAAEVEYDPDMAAAILKEAGWLAGSDGILEKNALVNLITRFEQDTDLNCMTGAILTIPEQIQAYKGFFPRLLRNLEFMEYAQAFLAGRSYASEMNAVYTLSGAFSAFRKSVVLKSWMYNTDTICEDTHITFQMKYRQNERVEVCEDAIFFVDPIEDMNKLYTQRQRWQRGSLEVAKMFMDKSFKVKNIFSNVSVKTLLYDHTFAFPRMIWYLALICLMAIGYSGKMILVSTGIIFGLYTLAGYLYFIVVAYFLNINKDVKKYYVRHWWCILFLPFFNFLVFFIRVAGIINSIQTDSAWKTMNFTDECKAFAKVVKQDMQKPAAFIGKLRKAVNYEPMEDMELIEVEEADTPEAVDITEDKRNIMEDKTMAEDSKEAAEKIEQIGLIDEDESL